MSQKLEEQLKELGSKLGAPPASKDDLLEILKHGMTLLTKLHQLPMKSILEAMQPFLNAIVKPELLKHHDREVKIFVAACICVIARVTAPEAPYDDDTSTDIFQLIVSTFNGLIDVNSPAFEGILVILESLGTYRLCVVMLDLKCDDLIAEMFNTFFTVVRDEHPEDVFTSMQTIMEVLLKESEDVPENLLRTLLSVLGRENEDVTKAGRRLAMNVVKHCAGKLEPGIKQFLVSSESGDSKSLKSEINYHALLYDIYQAAPHILSGVLPLFKPSVEEETKFLEAGVLNSMSFQPEKCRRLILSDADDNEEQPSNVDECKPTPSSQNDKPTSSLEFSGSISGMLDSLHSVESHLALFENTTTCLDKSIKNSSLKFQSVESDVTHMEKTTTCLDKSAENLSRKFQSVESNITRLVDTTTCLEKSVDSLSRKFQGVESNITCLENTTACLDKSVESLFQKIHSVELESHITSLEKTTASLDKCVENLSQKFHSVESNITRLENTTTCLDKSVESLSRRFQSVESQIACLENATTGLDEFVEKLSRKFQSVGSNMTRLENTATSLDKSVQNLSRKLGTPPLPDVTDDLEYRAIDNDAWYSVRLVLDAGTETLTVNYLSTPGVHKVVFSAGDFMTEAPLEELFGRFRPVSRQLQDAKCLRLSVGTFVRATYGIGDNDTLFYDAIVEAVEHKLHSFAGGKEECLCSFVLSWQHGPGRGTSTPANITGICVLEPTSQIDPRLHAFGEMVNKKIASSSKSDSAVPCLDK